MTPAQCALREAAAAETARIYGATMREKKRDFDQAQRIAEGFYDGPGVIAERRRIAESMSDTPALRVVS